MDAVFSLHGLAASKGYAIGKAVLLDSDEFEIPRYTIHDDTAEHEYQRVVSAIQKAKEDIHHHIESFPDDAPSEILALLNVHEMMLCDPILYEGIQHIIQTQHCNAEWALSLHGKQLVAQFAHIDDEYLRERAQDIQQLIQLILKHLLDHNDHQTLHELSQDQNNIIIATDISPADMLKLRQYSLIGFCTGIGSINSHTAIVARSMGIPAIVNLQTAKQLIKHNDKLIIDGFSGTVIVNPNSQILQHYTQAQTQYQHTLHQLDQLKTLRSIGPTGQAIDILANIETPEEAAHALDQGAEGIGLFRSEFLFLNKDSLPSEEEQYQAYRDVLTTMQHRPVTIRTIDIGADKLLHGEHHNESPLGQRGIRYALAHHDLFRTQLRALLRASTCGQLRILIPMISHAKEMTQVRQLLQKINEELAIQGQSVDLNSIPVGAMIEVPAAALSIDLLAPVTDFISIGTNDLIQYTLAIDRSDPQVAELYNPQHPAVLRLIKYILKQAKEHQLPASICGEMAGDEQFTHTFLDYGLTQFSMNASQIPSIKACIRQYNPH